MNTNILDDFPAFDQASVQREFMELSVKEAI